MTGERPCRKLSPTVTPWALHGNISRHHHPAGVAILNAARPTLDNRLCGLPPGIVEACILPSPRNPGSIHTNARTDHHIKGNGLAIDRDHPDGAAFHHFPTCAGIDHSLACGVSLHNETRLVAHLGHWSDLRIVPDNGGNNITSLPQLASDIERFVTPVEKVTACRAFGDTRSVHKKLIVVVGACVDDKVLGLVRKRKVFAEIIDSKFPVRAARARNPLGRPALVENGGVGLPGDGIL